MNTSLFAGITVLVLTFAIAAPAASQTPQAGATTNMDILVAKLKADKKLLVAETVGLTDAEGKAFGPFTTRARQNSAASTTGSRTGSPPTRKTSTPAR